MEIFYSSAVSVKADPGGKYADGASKEDPVSSPALTGDKPDSESASSSKRLVVTELGNFCEKLSRGLESALEGDDGSEVERLAQKVRVRRAKSSIPRLKV